VCPAKYRRVIFTDEVDEALKEVCMEIGKRYEIHFVEIGTDKDHVHFLVQSVPMYSPTKIVKVIKSITAREVFRRVPSVRKELWGGEFWTDGYYVNTVSKYGNEDVIRKYVEERGGKGQYKKLHNGQLRLF
jgi:REP element-mobilizing transposase RayT